MKKLFPLLAASLLYCHDPQPTKYPDAALSNPKPTNLLLQKSVDLDKPVQPDNKQNCDLSPSLLRDGQRNIYFSCFSETADEDQCRSDKKVYLGIIDFYKEQHCEHLIQNYYFGE